MTKRFIANNLNCCFMKQICMWLIILFCLFTNGCAGGSLLATSTQPISPAETVNKSVVEKDGLRLELETPQKEYIKGEPVPISLKVQNITSEEKTLNFTCYGKYELYLEDLEKKNREIIKDAACEIVGTSTVLIPSQAMVFLHNWEQQKKDKTYPDYGEYDIGVTLKEVTNLDFATISLKIKRNEDIKRTYAGEKAILWTDKYVYSMNEEIKYYLKIVNDTNSPISTVDNCSNDYFPYVYKDKVLIWTWDDGLNGWLDCFGVGGRTMLPGEEFYFKNEWLPSIANRKLSESDKINLLKSGKYELVVVWITPASPCRDNPQCQNRLSVDFILKRGKNE